MVIAGLGCRRGVAAESIVAAVAEVSARHGLAPARLATGPTKAREAGILEAAARLGLELVVVAQADLAAVADRTLTRSAASLRATGLPSLAEAAALAAAGPGARLARPRSIHVDVTVALALTGDEP